MKKLLFLATIAAVLCSCNNQKFVIKGDISGISGTMVYLFDSQENIIDSAAVENGSSFRIKGDSPQPGLYFLSDSRGEEPASFSATVILEPGTILITDSAENPSKKAVTGTPANDANTAYGAASNSLVTEYREPTTTEERRAEIENAYKELNRSTLDANRDNLFGVIILVQQLGYELSGQEVIDEIARFSPAMQESEMLSTYKQNAEQKMKTEVGKSYINIEQNNVEGTPVSLQSVIENPANKYTLLDFWASWCGPCMEEIPFLKKSYDEFHAKGFEIYGVSLDQERSSWTEAITKHGMNWIQVSALKGFDTPTTKEYAIQGIPTNLLIDAQGKIVALDLRGEALYAKIAELLAE